MKENNNNNNNNNNPTLRFKDLFGNKFPDLEIKKLGEIVTIKKGEQLNKKLLTTTGKFPAINGGLTPSGYTNKTNSVPNTITISEGGNSCGFTNFIKQPFWSGGHCYTLIKLGSNIQNKYLYQNLKSQETKTMRLRVGSGLPNIQKKDMLVVPINLPSLPEQEKVGNFFSKLDENIELYKEEHALLIEYKKGLMQKIFSQELRFKDKNGDDFPDWKEKKLGDICNKVDYGLNASAIKYDGKNQYIRITDIDEDTRAFMPKPLTSPHKFSEKHLLNKNDILFARTGASVGKSYLHKTNKNKVYFAGFLIRFQLDTTIAHPYFVLSQTLTQKYDKWLKITSIRTGQPGINAKELKNMRVVIPNIKEQEKIASILSMLDEKIELSKNNYTKAETHKKALMQQMFS